MDIKTLTDEQTAEAQRLADLAIIFWKRLNQSLTREEATILTSSWLKSAPRPNASFGKTYTRPEFPIVDED